MGSNQGHTHLSLGVLVGRAAGPKEVLLAEELAPELLGPDVADVPVCDGDPAEGLDLHPTHQVHGCQALVQEDLHV